MNNKKGLLALPPLMVFIVLYLVLSLIAGDFYKVPIRVAFMMASIYAIAMSSGHPLTKRIDVFSRGTGSSNLLIHHYNNDSINWSWTLIPYTIKPFKIL